ncbi:MAG: hypothetical protein ACI8TP_003187 [Acidimicrobiales bacterium]
MTANTSSQSSSLWARSAAFGTVSLVVAIAAIDLRQWSDRFDSIGDSTRIAAAPIAMLAVTAIVWRSPSSWLPSLRREPMAWLWAWILWAAVSGLAGPAPLSSLVFASTAGAIAVLATQLRSDRRLLPAAIAGAGALFVVVSAAARLGGADMALSAGRLELLAFEANQLARFMGITCLAGLWLAASSRCSMRIIGLVAALAGAGMLALTQSRTGLAALIAALAFLAYQRYGRRFALWAWAGGFGALAGMAALNKVDGVLQLFSRGNLSDLTSATGRTDVWPPFARLVSERPLMGHGVGAVDVVGRRATIEGELDFVAEHAHNLGLQVTVATGVVGLGLLGIGIVKTWRAAESPYALALLVFLAIDGLTEGVLLSPSFAWFALVAVACAGERSNCASTSDRVADSNSVSGSSRASRTDGDLAGRAVVKARAVPLPTD